MSFNIFKINPFIYFILFFFLGLFFLSREETKKENEIHAKYYKRIVSLSPSITRQIVELNSEDRLVGVTSFHPPLSEEKDIVGTLVQPNIEKIILLTPDIVLLSPNENSSFLCDRLTNIGIKIKIFESPDNFKKICNNFIELGKLLNKENSAVELINKYSNKYKTKLTNINIDNKIALLVSHDPIMTVSKNSYIGNIITDIRANNPFSNLKREYPVISLEHLTMVNPDIIIVISHNGNDTTDFKKFIFNKFPELKASKNKNLYTIDPQFICYYTPWDYLQAKEEIIKIISKSNIIRLNKE